MDGSDQTNSLPEALRPLLDALVLRFSPEAVWLFGSRARGDADENSDWDLVLALRDDAPDEDFDPLQAWLIARPLGLRATILAARMGDIAQSWGVPNTIGYDLARDGCRLHVR